MASIFKRGGKENRGGYYYAQWFDDKGKRQTICTYTTDKSAADRIARKNEADAALRREGVIDATADLLCQQAAMTIDHHLVDFQAKLETAGTTAQHIRETIGYIRTIASASGFAAAADIQADSVQQFAQRLKQKGRSARTIQAHLTAMKGFTKWLAIHDKLLRDPLSSVKCPNPKTDRRLERRILLSEEWDRLEIIAKTAPADFGMSGFARSLLYATAIQTGLRSGELRTLTRGKLFLDAAKPYITCKAGATKNRKDARQYIDRRLAERLRAYLATRTPGSPVFDLPDESDMAQMLREDLARARAAWHAEAEGSDEERQRREESDFLAVKNHEGETLDFHSLRHTCGAWLAMTGAHPKVVQTVMRHSTITLTMDTYGHLFPSAESDAVDRLGELMHSQPSGTCSNEQESRRRKSRSTWRSSQDAAGSNSLPHDATPCGNGATPKTDRRNGKPLKTGAGYDTVRSGTMPCLPSAPLAQLAEQLTLNQ